MRFSSASGQAAKTKVSLVRLSVKVKVRHWMLRKLLAYRAWISDRSEEHTSELQSLMRISYAVFCLKKKKSHNYTQSDTLRRTRHCSHNVHTHREIPTPYCVHKI